MMIGSTWPHPLRGQQNFPAKTSSASHLEGVTVSPNLNWSLLNCGGIGSFGFGSQRIHMDWGLSISLKINSSWEFIVCPTAPPYRY